MTESVTTEPAAAKRPKHRSPSYPAIDLETAIGRTRQLHKLAGAHPARVTAVTSAWGYSAKSSNGLLSLAALKKYGLIEDEGSGDAREVKVTRLGQEIVFYAESTGEWLERAQAAALKPTIHAELWAKYGPTLPDDSVILPYLIFGRSFSESAARDALAQFRKTVAFAHLADAGASLGSDEEDSSGDEHRDEEPTLTTPTIEHETPAKDVETPRARDSRTVQVTYSPSEWALLQGKFPMSEDDWDAMIAVLQAMKRGLVSPE